MNSLTTETFDQAVNSGTSLVLFSGKFCSPCKATKKNMEKIDINKYVVDVEDESLLASRFMVRSIPTLILFKDGVPVISVNGLQSEEDLERLKAS